MSMATASGAVPALPFTPPPPAYQARPRPLGGRAWWRGRQPYQRGGPDAREEGRGGARAGLGVSDVTPAHTSARGRGANH